MADRIEHILQAAIDDGVTPGLAFGISRHDETPRFWFAGQHSHLKDAEPVEATTIFDLASLTKPLSTTLWVLRLIDEGRLDLNHRIGELVETSSAQLSALPLWQLMNHTSGLAAHRCYYERVGTEVLRTQNFELGQQFIREQVRTAELAYEPGEKEQYSDLGYLLLQYICESVGGTLGDVWAELPGHGPELLHFNDLNQRVGPLNAYAATEHCPWRHRLLQGEVHDDNCWSLGGIAGHAGLFGTVESVHHAGLAWLNGANGDGRSLSLAPDIVTESLSRHRMHPTGSRVLGWDTPSSGASTSGSYYGPRSFGHLGFTGTSIWIDPDEGIVMTLLTNRVCPSRDNWGIRKLRPLLHDAAWNEVMRKSVK